MESAEHINEDWTDKVSNHAQIGGIETSVLDNGAGRGTRIAWINTGAGLRFKVVIDRAMDIAEAFYNQHSLAWLSHGGITYPQPFSDKGIDWLRTFGGGLLTTCGLTHVGGPESDKFGDRGLHGLISNSPAEIVSIIQPEPRAGKLQMSITGIIRETKPFGPSLELRRTISATLGQPGIRIHDEVTNKGNTPSPHMLLYHFNFGWPLADEGTDILWRGKWHPRHGEENAKIFKEGNDFKKCPAPLEDHLGSGEEVALVDIEADIFGDSVCGLYNEKIGLAVGLKFKKEQLPWMANWQHWGKGEYVTGLEPSTHPLTGQAKAREDKTLIFIGPEETKVYDLELNVMTEKSIIDEFVLQVNVA
ncbi:MULTISPECIES: aldose 1-epimerase family protein [Dyadobacter]|uniref:Aldose 1-epimerase family protein n=1 Tax=Dyadobacter chenhuakuii TaxID=2909339 RepID=A0A9X1TW69_9BACT|nr:MULTISPECIES: aldose 1-epimerase family protein [Dyadobacter]MCF2501128.1 aldose 1-epimerase family protein [Dyadobacter chenhuakuii]MCF2519445.1 aldose 1-epimerase family protein [Dyadobacter sp. CY351]